MDEVVATALRLLTVIVLMVMAGGTARAVDPAHAITQYGHRIWRVGEAGLDASPKSIAQTRDGQIWVGTTDGLYRFDGKQFVRWLPASGDPISLHFVENLYGARNGDLYIGAQEGLFRISHGSIFKYPNLMETPGPFREDRAGQVWLGKVGHHSGANAFCLIGKTAVQCHGIRDGVRCWYDHGLAVGDGPDVWVGGYGGICHWHPGQPTRTFALGNLHAPVTSLAFGPHGALIAGVGSGGASTGLWALLGSRWTRFDPSGLNSRRLDIQRLLGDRQGSLWVGTHTRGLYRVAGPRTDHFDHLNGLSSDFVTDILEDEQGSIWVVTPRGVDQFLDLPITRLAAPGGSSIDAVNWLTPTPDGGILISDGLNIEEVSQDGAISRYGRAPGAGRGSVLLEDRSGRVWFGADGKLSMFAGGRVRSFNAPPGRTLESVFDLTEDNRGDAWASVQEHEAPLKGWLWHFSQGRLVERLPTPSNTGQYLVTWVASNSTGGLWLYVVRHGLFMLRNHTYQRVPGPSWKAGGGPLQIVPVAPEEAWLATGSGAVWVVNNRMRTLSAAQGLPCNHVYGIAFDTSGNLWLTTQCALTEVPRRELARWQRQPAYHVHTRFFGPASGYLGDEASRLVRSQDGRLWYTAGSEAYEFDPSHIPSDKLPPPVQVQSIKADQKSITWSTRALLPKLTRNLEIDYSGLSYLQPDLLKFHYRLVGHDREWNDVGNRRQAFYNDLAPGLYRFLVTACNNDDVCNEKGAAVTLVIPPAWWQTWLFRVICAFALACLLAAAVRWRLRGYARLMQIRFGDRLEERTRVARELHDTLMQTVLASKMLAEGGKMINSVPEGRATLTRISEWLGHAADEGRAAVDSLRTSVVETNHLMDAFELIALESRRDQDLKIHVAVIGKVRELHPIARDEIYRIGVEAIRNACAHSGAKNIHIELRYAQNIIVSIRDDGTGVDKAVLEMGRSGHFGLVGMRERAENIGAKLTITSSPKGTLVVLNVPGTVVFADHSRWLDALRRLRHRGDTTTRKTEN